MPLRKPQTTLWRRDQHCTWDLPCAMLLRHHDLTPTPHRSNPFAHPSQALRISVARIHQHWLCAWRPHHQLQRAHAATENRQSVFRPLPRPAHQPAATWEAATGKTDGRGGWVECAGSESTQRQLWAGARAGAGKVTVGKHRDVYKTQCTRRGKLRVTSRPCAHVWAVGSKRGTAGMTLRSGTAQ